MNAEKLINFKKKYLLSFWFVFIFVGLNAQHKKPYVENYSPEDYGFTLNEQNWSVIQ